MSKVQEGVQLVGHTGKALETIVAEVQEINRHVLAIVESAQEQSSGLQQINTAVNQMDQDTQKNAAMVEETTAASYGLAQEVVDLNGLLAQVPGGRPRRIGRDASPCCHCCRDPSAVAGQGARAQARHRFPRQCCGQWRLAGVLIQRISSDPRHEKGGAIPRAALLSF